MLRIGITGSIAAGKSFVTSILREEAQHVIDADVIAHAVCEPGEAGAAAVAGRFGTQYLRADGGVDRAALGAYVFAEPERRRALEALLHPIIGRAIEARFDMLEKQGEALAFLDAALLIEAGMRRSVDRLWLVVCNDAIRLERLLARDGFTREQALARMASQMPQEEKKRYADVLIDNSSGPAETRHQVLRLLAHEKRSCERVSKGGGA